MILKRRIKTRESRGDILSSIRRIQNIAPLCFPWCASPNVPRIARYAAQTSHGAHRPLCRELLIVLRVLPVGRIGSLCTVMLKCSMNLFMGHRSDIIRKEHNINNIQNVQNQQSMRNLQSMWNTRYVQSMYNKQSVQYMQNMQGYEVYIRRRNSWGRRF